MVLSRFRIPVAVGAAAVAAAVPAAFALAGGAASASAAATTRDVVNTETVQARLDATGEVTEARIYEQIAITGDGEVRIVNPVSTEGLRNLDGFGGVDVEGDDMVATVDVEGGRERLRTVSDYVKELPLDVQVAYVLDGDEVQPDDIVGRSGDLEVRYSVTNRTGTSREVSYDDGTGQQVTENLDVVIPMVGSLTTVLPSTFTDVRTQQANVAGDGRGGTRLSFTMTLFPPIGNATAEFGYTASIRDGEVPAASISALPVQPLESPSFAAGAESFKGGAETGIELTNGATEIDTNVLRLRDGASTLLAGLIQLQDGAAQLEDGLAGSAAPGAERLADGAQAAADGAGDLSAGASRLDAGAGELAAGASRLDAGAGDLAAGVSRLDAGAGDLAGGAGRLRDGLSSATAGAPALLGGLTSVSEGLGRVDAGLAQLSGGIGALETDPNVNQLRGGIQQLITGIGSNGADGTLLNGLARVDGGLTQLQTELAQAAAGVENLYGELGCGTVIAPGTETCTDIPLTTMSPNPLDPTGPMIPTGVLANNTLASVEAGADDGVDGIGAFGTTDTLLDGVNRVRCGLSNVARPGCPTTNPGLLQGLQQVQGGVEQLIDTVIANVQGAIGTPTSGQTTLRGGVAALQGGVGQLQAGGGTLAGGLRQLADGSVTLADGAETLADGTGQLDEGAGRLADGTGDLGDGAGRLADGTGELEDGASRLADGTDQIAEGAFELSDGLTDAAEGSGRLSDGLDQAAGGGPQLVDGAQRLSDEGTSQLVEAGKDTAADFGQRYALISAGAERAETEAMAYGAPEGARGQTAYALDIEGVDGEGGRNLGRGLAALAVFGLGAGLVTAVRGRLF